MDLPCLSTIDPRLLTYGDSTFAERDSNTGLSAVRIRELALGYPAMEHPVPKQGLIPQTSDTLLQQLASEDNAQSASELKSSTQNAPEFLKSYLAALSPASLKKAIPLIPGPFQVGPFQLPSVASFIGTQPSGPSVNIPSTLLRGSTYNFPLSKPETTYYNVPRLADPGAPASKVAFVTQAPSIEPLRWFPLPRHGRGQKTLRIPFNLTETLHDAAEAAGNDFLYGPESENDHKSSDSGESDERADVSPEDRHEPTNGAPVDGTNELEDGESQNDETCNRALSTSQENTSRPQSDSSSEDEEHPIHEIDRSHLAIKYPGLASRQDSLHPANENLPFFDNATIIKDSISFFPSLNYSPHPEPIPNHLSQLLSRPMPQQSSHQPENPPSFDNSTIINNTTSFFPSLNYPPHLEPIPNHLSQLHPQSIPGQNSNQPENPPSFENSTIINNTTSFLPSLDYSLHPQPIPQQDSNHSENENLPFFDNSSYSTIIENPISFFPSIDYSTHSQPIPQQDLHPPKNEKLPFLDNSAINNNAIPFFPSSNYSSHPQPIPQQDLHPPKNENLPFLDNSTLTNNTIPFFPSSNYPPHPQPIPQQPSNPPKNENLPFQNNSTSLKDSISFFPSLNYSPHPEPIPNHLSHLFQQPTERVLSDDEKAIEGFLETVRLGGYPYDHLEKLFQDFYKFGRRRSTLLMAIHNSLADLSETGFGEGEVRAFLRR
ncbi:MAG: hypothetical protein M1812_006163 [Candelaria pacifica]|nr:MAG: hypothetical protein M1812_006163 [Candelaria pacifica]